MSIPIYMRVPRRRLFWGQQGDLVQYEIWQLTPFEYRSYVTRGLIELNAFDWNGGYQNDLNRQ